MLYYTSFAFGRPCLAWRLAGLLFLFSLVCYVCNVRRVLFHFFLVSFVDYVVYL